MTEAVQALELRDVSSFRPAVSVISAISNLISCYSPYVSVGASRNVSIALASDAAKMDVMVELLSEAMFNTLVLGETNNYSSEFYTIAMSKQWPSEPDFDSFGGSLAKSALDIEALNKSNAFGFISIYSNVANSTCLQRDLLCAQVSGVLKISFFLSTRSAMSDFRRNVLLLHQTNTSSFSSPRLPHLIDQECDEDKELHASCTAEMTWGYAESEVYLCEKKGFWSVQCPVYTMSAECIGGAPGEICQLLSINETRSICLCSSPYAADTSGLFTDQSLDDFSLYVARGMTSVTYKTHKNSSMLSQFSSSDDQQANSDVNAIDMSGTISIAVPAGVLLLIFCFLVAICRKKYKRNKHHLLDAWKAANNGLIEFNNGLYIDEIAFTPRLTSRIDESSHSDPDNELLGASTKISACKSSPSLSLSMGLISDSDSESMSFESETSLENNFDDMESILSSEMSSVVLETETYTLRSPKRSPIKRYRSAPPLGLESHYEETDVRSESPTVDPQEDRSEESSVDPDDIGFTML